MMPSVKFHQKSECKAVERDVAYEDVSTLRIYSYAYYEYSTNVHGAVHACSVSYTALAFATMLHPVTAVRAFECFFSTDDAANCLLACSFAVFCWNAYFRNIIQSIGSA